MSDASHSPQKISIRLIALMILALIGLGLSIALSQHFYELRSGAAGFKSYCNLNAQMNCDVVAASSWAEFLPGLPLSSMTAGWYLGLFFIYLIAIGFNVRREAFRAAFILTAIGTLASLFYLYVMTARIGTFCMLCLFVDAVNFISLGIVISLRPQGPGQGRFELSHWKGFAAIMALSLFVAVVGLKGLDTLADRGENMMERAQAVLTRAPVSINVAPTDLVIGPANARITIIEFSDFQCPFCRVGAFTLHAVMSRFPLDVRVVMKPFPLDPSCNRLINHAMHPVSCEATKAALCAGAQGHFEETYEKIFQNQESLAPGKAAEYAVEAGANPAQLAACMASNETLAKIQATIEVANGLGIESTPTFFINGLRVDRVEALPVWSEIIQQLLKK
jgi:protein-disulfide isomerase/uncharacterized membrane protein